MRPAGLPEAAAGPNEGGLAKGFGRLLHLADSGAHRTQAEWEWALDGEDEGERRRSRTLGRASWLGQTQRSVRGQGVW